MSDSVDVFALTPPDHYYSPGYGAELTVVAKVWPFGVAEHTGALPAAAVHMSADGKCFRSAEWHKGKEADPVYVEIHCRHHRACFGWVDRESRQLLVLAC